MKKTALATLALIAALATCYLVFSSNNEPENTYANTIPEQALNIKNPEKNELVNATAPSAAKDINLALDGKYEDELIDKNHQAETEVSIGSFLSPSEQTNVLNTEELNNYSVYELRQSIVNLDNDGSKNNLAIETEYKLERKLSYVPEMTYDTARCSAAMCALMFSSTDEKNVSKALDQLSRDDELSALSGGGYLRHIEEDGVHYGVLVLVFKGDLPLSIN